LRTLGKDRAILAEIELDFDPEFVAGLTLGAGAETIAGSPI
jgi:hypothetical protein